MRFGRKKPEEAPAAEPEAEPTNEPDPLAVAAQLVVDLYEVHPLTLGADAPHQVQLSEMPDPVLRKARRALAAAIEALKGALD